MERFLLLETWLKSQLPGRDFKLSPASADASFRRYFRVVFEDGTLIAMDAPPEQEDCQPFLHVARLFAEAGTNVPAILGQDIAQGWDQGFRSAARVGRRLPNASGRTAAAPPRR